MIPMIVVVLAIWLVGTWVTKYSLEEMALFTPIAVAALGALAGVILLWVKVVRDSLRRRAQRTDETLASPTCPSGRTASSDAGRTVDCRCKTAPGRSKAAITPR